MDLAQAFKIAVWIWFAVGLINWMRICRLKWITPTKYGIIVKVFTCILFIFVIPLGFAGRRFVRYYITEWHHPDLFKQ